MPIFSMRSMSNLHPTVFRLSPSDTLQHIIHQFPVVRLVLTCQFPGNDQAAVL